VRQNRGVTLAVRTTWLGSAWPAPELVSSPAALLSCFFGIQACRPFSSPCRTEVGGVFFGPDIVIRDGFCADPRGQGGGLWRHPEADSGDCYGPQTRVPEGVQAALPEPGRGRWGQGQGRALGPGPLPELQGSPALILPLSPLRRNWLNMRNSRIR
jgi:hypothetical protein